ncbi:TPA: hypothetical protein QIB60_000906 [Enterobacter cloacae subsp. dissolvens]|nr:hypothetical protein [Enterobacter cloacae subsp. dissolvens]HDT0658300.1 hypothetical protein [Enterobacter cloacae subsp. dissolvens]
MRFLRNTIYIILALIIGITVFAVSFSPAPGEGKSYRESDTISYSWFTSDLIKHVPRISQAYEFEYRSQDGASPEMNSVTFYHTRDAEKLRNYLKEKGFTYETTDSFGEQWTHYDSGLVTSLVIDKSQQIVILTELSYP